MTDTREIEFIEMKQKDIKILREKIWLENDKKCPVLGKEIPLEKMALDHNHKRKDDEYSLDKGTVRTSMDFRANAILGKLENSIKRAGLDKEEGFDIGEFLRNAADYFDRGAYVETIDGVEYAFIHPKEVHKPSKLKKSSYNKLKKVYRQTDKKARFPEYPRSACMTKKLQELFDELGVTPEFY